MSIILNKQNVGHFKPTLGFHNTLREALRGVAGLQLRSMFPKDLPHISNRFPVSFHLSRAADGGASRARIPPAPRRLTPCTGAAAAQPSLNARLTTEPIRFQVLAFQGAGQAPGILVHPVFLRVFSEALQL
jgi:hypothetical protein